MLPTERRLPEVYQLIEQRAYFVLHAPRQTGKTTTMMQLARELTASGRYTAVVLSVETGEPFNADPGQAELTILGNWRRAVLTRLPVDWQPPPWPTSEPGARIRTALSVWSLASERPLVVFLDEIDSLQDETLSAILRQLRDGYNDRPRGFPHALGLVSMRDVRDYKIASGGSPRLPQTWEYADQCNADEQHLVIFDRTTKKPWSKKVFKQTTRHRGRAIKVWGM